MAARYSELLAPHVEAVPQVIEGGVSNWAQYTIEHRDRDGLAAHLKTAGVPTAVYYPIPIHQQAVYAGYPKAPGGLPVTEAKSGAVISLPMHPYLEPQVQSQIIQILKFADGLITQNPSFESANCHLPSGANLVSPSGYPYEAESHYVTFTGISNISITNGQGQNNDTVSNAYKKVVPGVGELVIGPTSAQIIAPTNNTYTLRFTGNGQAMAIEDVRGKTNEPSDAVYVVRYNDLSIPNGRVAELKIVNGQIENLKYDADGDGLPDTIVPPSRVVNNPSSADLEPPLTSVTWGKIVQSQRVYITATDSGSGVKWMMYRGCFTGGCGTVNGSSAGPVLPGAFLHGIEVVTEDNDGNRSAVVYYPRPNM